MLAGKTFRPDPQSDLHTCFVCIILPGSDLNQTFACTSCTKEGKGCPVPSKEVVLSAPILHLPSYSSLADSVFCISILVYKTQKQSLVSALYF